jgi:type IV pilus assembly protein PilC
MAVSSSEKATRRITKPVLVVDEAEEKRFQKRRVPRRMVVLFARHLATMLRSGVPIVQCLDTLRSQPESPHLGEVIDRLGRQIESGHKFSNALARFPLLFSPIFVTMVTIGEQTGGLDASLDRLASWMESDEGLAQSIKSALTYPIFVLIVSAILTLTVFYTVLPGFVDIFASMHIPLPLITQIILGLTTAIRKPLFWIVAITLAFGGCRLYQRESSTPEGQVRMFQMLLRVPLISSLLFEGTSARYCAAASALLGSGMDLTRSFRLAAGASGNPVIIRDAPKLIRTVMDGEHVSAHMARNRDVYSGIMMYMVRTGEEASRLPEMLQQAALFHEMETRSKVDALKAALEPLMLMAVALVVGTIVVSVFLPMYSYLNKLS